MVYIETFCHHIPSYVQVNETLAKSKCKNCKLQGGCCLKCKKI
jgi:hypothetical protein